MDGFIIEIEGNDENEQGNFDINNNYGGWIARSNHTQATFIGFGKFIL